MSVKSFLKLMFFCYYGMPTLNKAYLILSYLIDVEHIVKISRGIVQHVYYIISFSFVKVRHRIHLITIKNENPIPQNYLTKEWGHLKDDAFVFLINLISRVLDALSRALDLCYRAPPPPIISSASLTDSSARLIISSAQLLSCVLG